MSAILANAERNHSDVGGASGSGDSLTPMRSNFARRPLDDVARENVPASYAALNLGVDSAPSLVEAW